MRSLVEAFADGLRSPPPRVAPELKGRLTQDLAAEIERIYSQAYTNHHADSARDDPN
jgi:hypothetical protein